MSEVDLDSVVDYKAEYAQAIQKHKIQGNKLIGLCPFHQDKNASFSADLEHGKYKCFACGAEGNFVTFWANINGTDTKEAYKQILEKYHVAPPKPEYTVEDYAYEKRLPQSWLQSEFGLESKVEKDGTPYIYIPYYGEDHKKALFRKRYKKGSPIRFKWGYGSAGKLIMYGEQYLSEIRTASQTAILVEGESDTQTLKYLGFDALGVPGASTFHPEWCQKLIGINTLYLHIEPDNGGQTFLQQMAQKLHDGGYKGTVKTWTCGDFEVKDPSELFIKFGKEAAHDKVGMALRAAKDINLARLMEDLPAPIDGQPIRLRQPEGFIYSDKGISSIDEKTNAPVLICRTPILITKRLRSTETGDEKIEVAFLRDGEWHSTIQNRSTVFQSRSITTLADQGCTVTSENAKMVVKFLERLEAENIDIIEKADSASTFGWQSKDRFLPGLAPNIELDIEPSLRGWANAYSQSGTLESWIEMLRPYRQDPDYFRLRFILASSFAAPLLRIVRQRIFFVYNWGGSKGGKSAALKAALSVWGDPERLMVNFNATQVALERMAGFYCDLPLGLDERQLAGNNQGALEKIVYMLASGTGRIRGSKTGGLQAMQTWRTIVLATGEEPITTETSQTGVSTRVLEIYGAPFKAEQDAARMHQSAADNYGWAGVEFLKKVIEVGDEKVRETFNEWLDVVYQLLDGKNGSHASGIAAVAAADQLVSEWLFGDTDKDMTFRMVHDIVAGNSENSVRDVNESATEFVSNWIASNNRAFVDGEGYSGIRYGELDETYAYVFPSILNKVLKDAGYSPKKTMKYFLEQGIVKIEHQGGVERNSVVRRFKGVPQRFVKINLNRVSMDAEGRAQEDEERYRKAESFGNAEVQNGNIFDFLEPTDSDELPF